MGTTLVRRPARLAVPDPGSEPVVVAAPPQVADAAGAGMSGAMIIMPVVSGTGGLLIALTNRDRPLFAVAGLLFLVASVAVGVVMFLSIRLGPRRRLREQRERYLDYLEDLRVTLRTIIAAQCSGAAFRHPAPDLLPDAARLPARRWERRAGDPDFLRVRIGQGTVPLARPLSLTVGHADPLVAYDPVCLGLAQQLVTRYGTVTDQPFVVDLSRVGTLSIVGDRAAGRAVARALLAQLVTFHSPEDLRVAVVRHPQLGDLWDSVKWLPHALDEQRGDGPLPRRLVAATVFELAQLLAEELEQRGEELQRRRGRPPGPGTRRLVVIVDGEFQSSLSGFDPGAGRSLADLGIHLVVLLASQREEPETVDERLLVDADGTVRPTAPDAAGRDGHRPQPAAVGTIDTVTPATLAGLARRQTPLRLAEPDSADVLSATVGLAEILGVPDVATYDAERSWRQRPARELLRVPIGVGGDGRPVMLDLKESAFGGMGPHGLLVGATGSGKSELLRTLVGALVTGHSPEHLALLLVDFKGGATFAGLVGLPHVAGIITNLADDMALVDRFSEAISGEMLRRQQHLKDLGNLPNLHAYRDLRDSPPESRPGTSSTLEPMPHLLVIIDEFSELLSAKPDFADLFVAIGRIGRSIGIHLLLATQHLEVGRIRGLESHLSYRIGLRTFSESESREAIGVPDAYHLPPEPGSGYLKVDTTVFERFRAAMVSQRYQPPQARDAGAMPVVPYTAGNGLGALMAAGPIPRPGAAPAQPVAGPSGGPRGAEPSAGDRTVLRILVERLAATGAAPVRPVWREPLPAALPLSAILPPATPSAAAPAPMRAPVPNGTAVFLPPRPSSGADAERVFAVLGTTDVPFEQRQPPLCWDFTGAEGNLIVSGAPLSGKSTLLRTLIAEMSLRYAPGQVTYFCVDYGGGTLAPLEDLPHVAAVAVRTDPDRMRRTVADVHALLDQREQAFRRHGIDSAAALRRARARGEVPAEIYGDVFLVIDGWGTLREAESDMEDRLVEISSRGPTLGIHTVLTVVTGNQVRTRLAGSFGGRIELRLNDPFDSVIDRTLAENLPKDVPGRALLSTEHYAQIALPRVDGRHGVDDLPAGLTHLISLARGRWPHHRVAPVRVLPDRVELAAIHGWDTAGGGPVVGVSERDLGPVRVDLLGADPHFIVYGDPQTGKSNLLRVLIRQLMSQHSPQRLGIVLVDYRRAHLDLVPAEYLLAYCTSAPQVAQVTPEVCASLRQRLPTAQVTPEQLRRRSWWTGPEVVIVADDYDLVATGGGNPLLPLSEFLPHGRDLGVHLVLARRTGGAARSLYEPVLQAVTDLAGCGALFSGDRLEGQLVNGVAPARLPVGRTRFCRRGLPPEQVQIAWTEPPG
jgi:S-DNA-T family DNA segregation ATPase FtsK/SpoIIIE